MDENLFVFIGLLVSFICFCIGLGIGSNRELEIQDVRPVENGYYVTIDNNIYYKEVM